MEELEYEFVFAGNMIEVERYRIARRLSLKQVRFVRDFRAFQGHFFDPPLNMPLIGTFWWRTDAQLIVHVAESHGIIPTATQTLPPTRRPS